MEISEIMQIIEAVRDNNLTSFELKEGDVSLSMKREPAFYAGANAAAGAALQNCEGALHNGTMQNVPSAQTAGGAFTPADMRNAAVYGDTEYDNAAYAGVSVGGANQPQSNAAGQNYETTPKNRTSGTAEMQRAAAAQTAGSTSAAAGGAVSGGQNSSAVDSRNGEASGTPASADAEKVVVSPLVGVFYNAPSPDADPFVRVGDTIKKGQIIGIVEAMKLMNEIESDQDGIVTDVLIGNEEVVEYGQPLIRVK